MNAEAGFFDRFFGGEASASSSYDQDIVAFSAKASPDDKNYDECSQVTIVADTSLQANSPCVNKPEVDYSDGQIEIYVVRAGDTVAIVADLFNVSEDTILSANDLVKGSKLKTDDVLLILPFSGIEHTVTKGETLKGIATKYKIDQEDIMSANHLDTATIVVGDRLIIPGANIINQTKPKGTSNVVSKGSSKVPSVAGYFVNPVPSAVKSRGLKPGHKGVDLAAPTGTPIRASAEGVVMIARNGSYAKTSNGGFGTYVIIQHPNGTKTLYAHMSKLGTSPGARVSQGETIGYVGNTGRSTGPHLHFEVIGAKNPF